jgi:hypothetical protein
MADRQLIVRAGDHAWFVADGADPKTGTGSTVSEIGPDTCVFSPGGTFHALDHPNHADPAVLARWSRSAPGANDVCDARIAAWGTSFRTTG